MLFIPVTMYWHLSNVIIDFVELAFSKTSLDTNFVFQFGGPGMYLVLCSTDVSCAVYCVTIQDFSTILHYNEQSKLFTTVLLCDTTKFC